MDVFEVHRQLIDDYAAFTTGFTEVRDPRIGRHVQQRLDNGDQWPDPYLSLNPNFASGGSVSELVGKGLLHPECERIFRVGKDGAEDAGHVLDLHQHQRDAEDAAKQLAAAGIPAVVLGRRAPREGEAQSATMHRMKGWSSGASPSSGWGSITCQLPPRQGRRKNIGGCRCAPLGVPNALTDHRSIGEI